MSQQVMQAEAIHRTSLVQRGRTLEHFTIAYNSLEGLIALVAGFIAGSIALVGFGFDSVIEVTSGATLLWRLHADVDEVMRERAEAFTLRTVGVCFLVLALYVGYEAVSSLVYRVSPARSVPGILLVLASLMWSYSLHLYDGL
jgi:divalent metal cation (Fe/Co/Zn/Cd) transporter